MVMFLEKMLSDPEERVNTGKGLFALFWPPLASPRLTLVLRFPSCESLNIRLTLEASFELPKPLAERCGLPFEGLKRSLVWSVESSTSP